jgi:hypothetical protein
MIRLQAGRPGFGSRQGSYFPLATMYRPGLGHTKPPIQWLLEWVGLYSEVMHLGHEANHSLQCTELCLHTPIPQHGMGPTVS